MGVMTRTVGAATKSSPANVDLRRSTRRPTPSAHGLSTITSHNVQRNVNRGLFGGSSCAIRRRPVRTTKSPCSCTSSPAVHGQRHRRARHSVTARPSAYVSVRPLARAITIAASTASPWPAGPCRDRRPRHRRGEHRRQLLQPAHGHRRARRHRHLDEQWQ